MSLLNRYEKITSCGNADNGGWIQPPVSHIALDVLDSSWDIFVEDDRELYAEISAWELASDEALGLVDVNDG